MRFPTKRFGVRRNRQRDRGFVLVALAVCLVMLIGILGLCSDLGRLYIAQNELQAYADAATAAANQELDGTDEGIERAREVASSYPNTWNLATQAVASPVVTFATTREGPYIANPTQPKEYKYVRVLASGSLPLYFMSVFWSGQQQSSLGPPAFLLSFRLQTARVEGDSAAGQFKVTRFDDNLLPYSPDAHLDAGRAPITNPGFTQPDPFNFEVGKKYTLRWPPVGLRDLPINWCAGDREANFVTPDAANDRGFIDIGSIPGSTGSSYIRQAIISNVQTHPLQIGDSIINVPGNRGTESDALRERVNQDSDPYSATWSEYRANLSGGKRIGNGRRIVFVPVNNPFDSDRIIDFAAFFLPVDSQVCGTSNVAPCCAEYMGPGLLFGRTPATEAAGVYRTRLLQ